MPEANLNFYMLVFFLFIHLEKVCCNHKKSGGKRQTNIYEISKQIKVSFKLLITSSFNKSKDVLGCKSLKHGFSSYSDANFILHQVQLSAHSSPGQENE